MINSTQLKHDTVRLKIAGAMRKAMNKRFPHYITNRKGEPYLRVERLQGAVMGRVFQFLDKKGNDVTEMVYSGLAA